MRERRRVPAIECSDGVWEASSPVETGRESVRVELTWRFVQVLGAPLRPGLEMKERVSVVGAAGVFVRRT